MTDRWDGRPQNPEEDGLHYITDGVALWLAGPQKWALLNRGRRERPEWLAAQPWAEYRGPCPTSAELETRVAAARREGIEAALVAVDAEPEPEGEMPAKLANTDRRILVLAAVRATKREIDGRIRALLTEDEQ